MSGRAGLHPKPGESKDMSDLDQIVNDAEKEFIRLWQEGPKHTGWETLPVQSGDQAPSFSLPDQHGRETTLESLLGVDPLLLIFWRHFGCGCGFDRARRLREELDGYLEAGANVVIIGQGVPEQAAAYSQQEQLDVPILTDADRSVYRAYGLLEATMPQLLFDAPQWLWSNSAETADRFTTARRERGRPLVNSPWQLPGEFVIDPNGTIIYAYRYQHCENYPEPLTLMTAIKGGALAD